MCTRRRNARGAAGAREAPRQLDVHLLERLAAALVQDADEIHHRVHAVQGAREGRVVVRALGDDLDRRNDLQGPRLEARRA